MSPTLLALLTVGDDDDILHFPMREPRSKRHEVFRGIWLAGGVKVQVAVVILNALLPRANHLGISSKDGPRIVDPFPLRFRDPQFALRRDGVVLQEGLQTFRLERAILHIGVSFGQRILAGQFIIHSHFRLISFATFIISADNIGSITFTIPVLATSRIRPYFASKTTTSPRARLTLPFRSKPVNLLNHATLRTQFRTP